MIRTFTSVAVVAGLLLASCGDADPATSPSLPRTPPSEPTTTAATVPPNEGGAAEQIWHPGEVPAPSAQLFTGTVRLSSNGCWMIEVNGQDRLVAFPPGFSGADPTRLIGPEGLVILDGSSIDAVGQMTWIEAVPGGFDSRWGNMLTFCDPDGAEIAVLDRAETAYDPATVSDAELAAELSAAEFTTSWPCGFRFAVSTSDQRFGLILAPASTPAADGTVDLFDATWSAEIQAGKHLFVQNCDDAVEQWEADPVVATRWPITAGRFDIVLPTDEAAGCSSNPIRIELTGAVVMAPGGDIELPPITITNDAWGCFAG